MKRDNGMGEAIALSSPSGRMSKRARKRAEQRLHDMLFTEPEAVENQIDEHPDSCNCTECKTEKRYLIQLIIDSIVDEDSKIEKIKKPVSNTLLNLDLIK